MNKDPFIVQYVNFSYTDLVDHNGIFRKNVSIGEAKTIAKNANLDLVCFKEPENNQSALCKILDFGKWKYEIEKQKKKQNHNKKLVKEMKFTPNIEDHDIDYKIKQINNFLINDNDVIMYMILKGRQSLHFNEAEAKFNHIISMCNKGKEVSRKQNDKMIIVRLVKNIKDNKGDNNEKVSNSING